jgi:hypothetical protein
MCWSANGSLATWAAGMTLAGATYGYEPKLWLFMVLFTQMQLVEYFLWKNLKVPRLNVLGSRAAALVIFLEPVAAIYMIKDDALRNKMLAGYAVYVAALFMTQRFDFHTTVGGNGHLKWKWLPHHILLIPWFIFFTSPFLISGYYKTFVIMTATLLMSIYFFSKYGTASSMWCWVAVMTWIILLISKHKSQ